MIKMTPKQQQEFMEMFKMMQQPQPAPEAAVTAQGIQKWWPQLAAIVLIIAWGWNQSSTMTANNVKIENRLVQIEKILAKQEGQPDVKLLAEDVKSLKADVMILDKQIQAIRKN